MIDVLSSIAVAGFSFLFGALINRWWDRARPLIVLQGFSTTLELKFVEPTAELQQLSDDSWFSDRFPPDQVPLNEIENLYITAWNWERPLEDAAEKIASWRERVDKSSDIKDVFREIVTHEGMRFSLDSALRFEDFKVDESNTKSGSPLQYIEPSQDDDGSYMILWKKKVTTFGSSLNTHPFLKARFEPFINAMRYLDRQVLSDALKEIQPIVERQARILRGIQEITKPILDDHNLWAARFYIENYGASPMIISNKAKFIVKSGVIKKHGIPVDCKLHAEHSNPTILEDIKGSHVLRPGEKNIFWAITTQLQMDIKEKDTLQMHFRKKDAIAYLDIKTENRGLLLAANISSNDKGFIENLNFPNVGRSEAYLS